MTSLLQEKSVDKTTDLRSLSDGAQSLLSGLTNSLLISSTNARYSTQESTSKDLVQFNKDLSLVLINTTSTVGKSMLANIVIGEKPTVFKAGTALTLLVSRQFTSMLSGAMLQNTGASFTFPGNTSIFGNTSSVDSQVSTHKNIHPIPLKLYLVIPALSTPSYLYGNLFNIFSHYFTKFLLGY